MTLTTQLVTLESAGLIHLAQSQPDVEYLFRHALIYEAVHGSLVKRDRLQLHALVGEILEQQYPDRLTSPDLAPLLAYHFDQGQDKDRALKYYSAAGDAAFASFANMEAIDHYSRAIELAANDRASGEQIIQLYSQRGRAYELSGQYPKAEANYRELQAMAQTRGDRAMELATLISLATVYLAPTGVFDLVKGEQLMAQALDLARELNDRKSEVKILWHRLLKARFTDASAAEVVVIGEQALSLSRELDLKDQTAYILNDLMPSYFMLGEHAKGEAALHEAQTLWRETNNLAMLADSLSSEIEQHVYAGRFDQALKTFDEARHLSESIGNLWNQSYSRFSIGWVYFERGEISQAIQIDRDCIRLAEEAGFIIAQSHSRVELAALYAYAGQYQTAIDLLNVALDVANRYFPAAKVYPTSGLARVYSQLGQFDQVHHLLAQIDPLIEANMQYYSMFHWLMLSEVNLAEGKFTETLANLAVFLEKLDAVKFRSLEGDAGYLKGRALIGLERFDEAETVLSAAKQLAEEIGSRRNLWQILIALSEIELKRGHEMAAYKLRQQARQIVEYIAAHITQIDLRESFVDLPHIRAVLQE
jgi:tetratricopeptide (TPR) repeat protein